MDSMSKLFFYYTAEHAAPVLRPVTDESIRHTRALLRVWEEDSKSDGS